MFSLKPDYAQARERIDAFWDFDVLDRPVTVMNILKPFEELVPLPTSHHPDPAARWMDSQYQAELALASLSNQEFLGETLPIAFPNLGPEIFSVFYGCPLHFGDFGTSWTDPILNDWSQADALALDWNSPWLHRLIEMTDALLEIGKGKFITGMTDWHPGGDAIAAFRDPERLAMDLITHKADVQRLLDRINGDYFKMYDFFFDKLRGAGLPITSWTPLVSEGKYYIPSNDFSIMISKTMFNEIFLPGIIAECRFLDRSIYHLDGPGALRHLDSLLAIPELQAVQWVYGAGNEGFHRWVNVYRKIQSAGKGIQVICDVSELDAIMETLSPQGLFLSVGGVSDRAMGLDILKSLEKWTTTWRKGK
jgi:hypothetical protein